MEVLQCITKQFLKQLTVLKDLSCASDCFKLSRHRMLENGFPSRRMINNIYYSLLAIDLVVHIATMTCIVPQRCSIGKESIPTLRYV